jgi:hypothetical protein
MSNRAAHLTPKLNQISTADVGVVPATMDLIWHYARSEREGKTVQVENL